MDRGRMLHGTKAIEIEPKGGNSTRRAKVWMADAHFSIIGASNDR